MTSQEEDAAAITPLEAAAAWRVRLSENAVEAAAGHQAWLAADRAHRRAWRQVQIIWAALDAVSAHPKVLGYRREARVRLMSPRRSWPLLVLTGAAAALAAVFLTAAHDRAGSWRTISTPPGERRVVVLVDGSRLILDADSAARVRLVRSGRDVDLLRGQARFDVAHDANRPFRVHGEGKVVTALGTSFTVERIDRRLTVTLIEGRVSVTQDPPFWRGGPPPFQSSPTYLRPGERVSVAAATPAAVEAISLDRATAWESGRLVFDNEPLADAVERVSRYSTRPIEVGDPAAAQLRISGVFDAGDTRAFVLAVIQYFALEAVEGGNGETVLRSRRENSP